MLIATDKMRDDLVEFCSGNKLFKCDFTTDGVTGKDRTKKLEFHLARDEIHIPTDLGRHRGGQQTVDHQPALRVRLEMMHSFVTRKLREGANVFLGKGPLPGKDVADFHVWSPATAR